MRSRFNWAVTIVGMVVVLLAPATVLSVPTNGDFSQPISVGWTVESGTVTVVDEQAKFEEDESLMSSLINEQPFTIPDGALGLSFELKMEAVGLPTSDEFTASLLDAATLAPLVSYDPGVVDWYFHIEDPYVAPLTVATVEDIGEGWMRVTLPMQPSFIGEDVLLAFDLFSWDEDVTTAVFLDNVKVDVFVIPAPGALVLGLIGSCLVGLLRRSKTMQ